MKDPVPEPPSQSPAAQAEPTQSEPAQSEAGQSGTPAATDPTCPPGSSVSDAVGTDAGPGLTEPALGEMSINDLLATTPLGPILDTPVSQLLDELGLPALPDLSALPPMPGMPPLPVIDLTMLVKPLVELVGSFGTGDLAGAPVDPSQLFGALSSVLDTTISVASGALKVADGLWSGEAAMAATAKSALTSADTAALATQGSGMSIDIQVAAGIVGAGLLALQGVIAATVTKLVATVPVLTTPPGIAMAIGFAAEGLAEGTAIVAATRAQLLGPTAHMSANGAPVPVTGAPIPSGGPSPFAIAGSVLDAVAPVVGSLQQVPAMIPAALGPIGPATPGPANPGPARDCPDPVGSGAAEVRAAGLVGLGGGAGLGAPPPVLTPMQQGRPSMPGGVEPAATSASASPVRPSAMPGVPTPAGAAPMAAAGAARSADSDGRNHVIADYLVSKSNGQRVVGEMEKTSPPVLGGQAPRTPVDEIVDVALRLSTTDSR